MSDVAPALQASRSGPRKAAVRRQMVTTRDVSVEECPWLPEGIRGGTVLDCYSGATYGCISNRGRAMSEPGVEHPFFEVPRDALADLLDRSEREQPEAYTLSGR